MRTTQPGWSKDNRGMVTSTSGDASLAIAARRKAREMADLKDAVRRLEARVAELESKNG